MNLTNELIHFIRDHEKDDPNKLLLTAIQYPGIDVPFAVGQIIARQQIKEKLPTWYTNEQLVFPSKLSTEQCSSEITASYKERLPIGDTLCDLTGGLGIDAYYFSRRVKKVIYIERFPEYCEAARSNFQALGANHIEVIHADATAIADTIMADTFYIDPARRTNDNKRVFALSDCEPDVLQLKPLLLEHGQRLIVKISPMADIMETLRLLPETTDIHVLSVKNECKELLFVLGRIDHPEAVNIHAINFTSQQKQSFSFSLNAEKEAPSRLTDTIGAYLYEPNSALLKSGAFKLVASRYNVDKLHQHSHLYTSNQRVENFPGRAFHVDHVYDFSGKLVKQLSRILPKANITTRNFNLSVAEIRSRSGIKEGGDIYLFATTLSNGKQILIQAHK